MSALGNGSVNQKFAEGNTLPVENPSSTGGNTAKYESVASGPMKGGNLLKKGSRKAKEFMAKLRSMRKGGKAKKYEKSKKVRGGKKSPGILGTLVEDVEDVAHGNFKGDLKGVKEGMDLEGEEEEAKIIKEGEAEVKKMVHVLGGKKSKKAAKKTAKKRFWFFK